MSAGLVHALARLFAEEHKAAACTAAEGSFAGTRRVDDLRRTPDHLARLVVDAAIAAQITRIVEDNTLAGLNGRKLAGMAGKEFAMMFDFDSPPEPAPVLSHRAHAVRTNGNDLLHGTLFQRGQIDFRELPEHEIVSQTPGRIAGTALFFENAERGAEVAHHSCERTDDLAAAWIIGPHAAEPQAVFLGAVEDGELLLGDEFVAFGLREAHGVAIALKI